MYPNVNPMKRRSEVVEVKDGEEVGIGKAVVVVFHLLISFFICAQGCWKKLENWYLLHNLVLAATLGGLSLIQV